MYICKFQSTIEKCYLVRKPLNTLVTYSWNSETNSRSFMPQFISTTSQQIKQIKTERLLDLKHDLVFISIQSVLFYSVLKILVLLPCILKPPKITAWKPFSFLALKTLLTQTDSIFSREQITNLGTSNLSQFVTLTCIWKLELVSLKNELIEFNKENE